MHPITKKGREDGAGICHPPAGSSLAGEFQTGGFFPLPSISSFPASPSYCLTEPTAFDQGSRKPWGARRQGSLPAALVACVRSPVSVLPVHQERVYLLSTFAFAQGAFFRKTRRGADVSGEGKLTLHLIFKLQHLI